jgi:hypothetical protein
MVSVARALAASVVSLAIVIAASGWLYLIQPRHALAGPPVGDALPLDELSRRSAVPLLVFVAVWATAAVLLGLVAYAARAERLTAGVILALGVGGWCLLVAACGLLGVLDAVLPGQRQSLIGSLAPERVQGLSTALVAPLGLALVVVARGLARRKRRAWQVAAVLLCGLVALHLQHRFGYGAIVTSLVAVALLARRTDFDAPGDPDAHPRIVLHALGFAAAIAVYGVVTLWINRVMVDQPFTVAFALEETARAAIGSTPPARRTSPVSSASGSRSPCCC